MIDRTAQGFHQSPILECASAPQEQTSLSVRRQPCCSWPRQQYSSSAREGSKRHSHNREEPSGHGPRGLRQSIPVFRTTRSPTSWIAVNAINFPRRTGNKFDQGPTLFQILPIIRGMSPVSNVTAGSSFAEGRRRYARSVIPIRDRVRGVVTRSRTRESCLTALQKERAPSRIL